MKTWKIPVVWQKMGTVKVVAESLAEAIELAKDEAGTIPLPDDGCYLEGSWDVASEDVEYIRQCYNGNEEDAHE